LKRVIILRRARDELDGIYNYTAGRWGLSQAVRYDQMLRERIEGLATGPDRVAPRR
jgi:plasmid stabilization system protein ParE